MLFDYAAGSSNLVITGNVVNLLAGDPLTHRGIIFTQAASTVLLNTPGWSAYNYVYNATSSQNVFSIPTGTATGGILINGAFVQPQ